jgi:hypothetical protein
MKEQILEILNDCLTAEEQTYFGDPASPIINGKSEAAEKLYQLFQNHSKELRDLLED